MSSYPWYWVLDIIYVDECCFVQGSCSGAVPATRSRSNIARWAKPNLGLALLHSFCPFLVYFEERGHFWQSHIGAVPVTMVHWDSQHCRVSRGAKPNQGSGTIAYTARCSRHPHTHKQTHTDTYSENHMDSNMLYTPNCIGICKVCSLNSEDLWLRPRSPLRRWGAVKNIFGKPQFSWPIYSLVVFRCFQWNSRTFIW